MSSRCLLLFLAAACTWSCAQRRAGNLRKPAPVAAASSGIRTTFQRQITNARDAGDGDYLIRSLQARVAAQPDDLEARLELARRYQQVGSPELAVEHYRQAASRVPDSGEVQLLLAKCLRSLGLTAQAEQGLARFLKEHPQSAPEFSAWLGILRDELGDWKQGEAAHRAALALAPSRDDLHNNLGYNLLQQKRFPEAAEEFRQALALRPDSLIARNNLGLALTSQPAEALRAWQAGRDPASAHNNLAAALIEQGRYGEARKQLEVALGYNRNHPATLANLQLLSELDGQPVVLPSGQSAPARSSPAWKRILSALWKGLAGVEERKQPEAVRTAAK